MNRRDFFRAALGAAAATALPASADWHEDLIDVELQYEGVSFIGAPITIAIDVGSKLGDRTGILIGQRFHDEFQIARWVLLEQGVTHRQARIAMERIAWDYVRRGYELGRSGYFELELLPPPAPAHEHPFPSVARLLQEWRFDEAEWLSRRYMK